MQKSLKITLLRHLELIDYLLKIRFKNIIIVKKREKQAKFLLKIYLLIIGTNLKLNIPNNLLDNLLLIMLKE